MKTLVLTARHAAAYSAFATFAAALDQRLEARRKLRPERQRAARKGAETKRTIKDHHNV